MTVPSTALSVLQMSAIMRAENLRRFNVDAINKLLDEYTDTSYLCNLGLTGRERICRLANQLAALKNVTQEIATEIKDIVSKLRRSFELLNHMPYDTTYEVVNSLVLKLDAKYPAYAIKEKLRTYNRFVGVHGVEATKAETAQIVAELLVIGMNADAEGFRPDLEQTIQEIVTVMMTWM